MYTYEIYFKVTEDEYATEIALANCLAELMDIIQEIEKRHIIVHINNLDVI